MLYFYNILRRKLTLIRSQHLLIPLFLLIIFFYFVNLGGDIFNADQHFWFTRTQNFISAIKKGDLAGTYQNPKPGVTVMWMSGISLEAFLQAYNAIFKFRPLIYTYDTFKYVDFSAKFPLVLLAVLSLIYFYVVVRRMLGKDIALTALILLSLQPYYIGVNRLFHGDGVLNTFMLFATLSLMYFFFKPNLKLIALAGVFSGLAFLSKSQAVFLIPFTVLSLGIDYLFNKRPLSLYISAFCTWVLFFLLSVFILFPAMWVNPEETLGRILNEGIYVAQQGRNGGDSSNLLYITSIPRIFNILNILSFLFSLLIFAKNYKHLENKKRVVLILAYSFIFFYYLQMMLVSQKSPRYLLPIFPFVSLLGAYSLSFFQHRFNNAVLMIISVVFLIINYPHYLALSEKENWGSLANEAAYYLNGKPNAVDLKVVVLPKEHTFRPFFKGSTYGTHEILPDNRKADYVIVGYSENLPAGYAQCEHEKDVTFRYRIYWSVFKCDQL